MSSGQNPADASTPGASPNRPASCMSAMVPIQAGSAPEAPCSFTLPRRMATRAIAAGDRLTMREPPVVVDGFTMELVWHRRATHDPAHRWLREEIVSLAQMV